MKYSNAKKLENGDEVVVKETNTTLRVIRACVPRPMNMYQRKQVFVECDDGNTYCHTALR